MYLDKADVEKVEKLVDLAYTEHVRRILERALAKLLGAGIDLKDLEHDLGLSAGYLSKIRSKAVPSFQLVALLAFMADDPTGSLAKVQALRRA